MSVNSTTSSISLQAYYPQHKADPLKQAARPPGNAGQANQAGSRPVVNAQGQTTGTLINTVA